MVPPHADAARTSAAIGRLRNASRAAAAAPRHNVTVANRDLHDLLVLIDALGRRCVDHAGQAVRLEAELVAARVAADRAGDNLDTIITAVGDAGATGPVLRALHGKPATRAPILRQLDRQPATENPDSGTRRTG